MDRESLPSDAENYDVFCHRCQRTHRHFTFTREDYDRMIAFGAAQLREAIDTRALAYAMQAIGERHFSADASRSNG